jgi:predicted helicase
MSKQLINQYYNQRDNLKRVGVTNEMAIKQPFDNLILNWATAKHYVYVTEVTIKNENGKNIRPDGILMNELRIHKGYVESKDTNDTLDEEINKKLFKDAYPKTNIIFQDSIYAVLIQNEEEVLRVEMDDIDKLEKILNQFVNYKPAYIEKFDEALQKFREDIPIIVKTLRETIDEQYKINTNFIISSEQFFEICQKEINPQITKEDIREMIIQHILTEDLFKSVFDESDFHHENNIAIQLEKLVSTFMNRTVRQNQLGELGHYYKTLNAQAALVSDHHEKQKFLKVVYENFYKVYNPKGADKLGVVYTPNEIVRFMVQSTDYLLQKHFNKGLADKNVYILDPATGTGTFITDIIDFIPSQYLEHKYTNEIFANEVAILPYYVANLNIEYTYKQKMGKYLEFPNSCFVDTLDNIDGLKYKGKQINVFGFSSENAERIKRQNEQKISVIIGNPPYNANQANFNDFNKNREYIDIDKRIKETYVSESSATNKANLYDMYTRFYRWASDRIYENGVICMVTNNSYINNKAFDGFRKSIEEEFDFCYIIDLGGNIRELSGKDGIFLGEAHTVFGLGAMVGIAITFLVKSIEKINQKCQIKYIHPCDKRATRVEKFEWLQANNVFGKISFDTIFPDNKNNWIDLSTNDFEESLPIFPQKKQLNSIFSQNSLGLDTHRDLWVYDLNLKNLKDKISFFISIYNLTLKDDNYVDKNKIKWSRELKKYLLRNINLKYAKELNLEINYRPFTKRNFYADKYLSSYFFSSVEYFKKDNLVISINLPRNPKGFHLLSSNKPIDLHYTGDSACVPLYIFDKDGNRHDNITDWGLNQFTTYYQSTITKEDIFYYTYAVLHYPEYRKKYELNLKRDFPRLPFYDDFFKWVAWGKQLMDLHINYETVEPYNLKEINLEKIFDVHYKLKVKLTADKNTGTIYLDEKTSLVGIPASAWLYKLGNRTALEWILDQYKEKKPTDKTIAEKFNTYRFADYKNYVIDLLKRVCTVSVETIKIIEEMNK